MSDITETWASDPSADITVPTLGQQIAGFICGPADPGLFNWLLRELTKAVRNPNTDNTLTHGTIN